MIHQSGFSWKGRQNFFLIVAFQHTDLHQGKTDELQTHSGPKNEFQGNHTRIKYLVIRISSIGFKVSGKYDTTVKWLSKCT